LTALILIHAFVRVHAWLRKYSAPINYLIGKKSLEPLFTIGLVITMIQMSTIIISITSYVKSATKCVNGGLLNDDILIKAKSDTWLSVNCPSLLLFQTGYS
jgi:hypothetical protein